MANINLKSGVKSWAKRKTPDSGAWTETSDFYNTAAWKNLRKVYMFDHPLCEVSKFERKYHAGKDCDHIIPIRFGGARFDTRNLMSMTQFYHRRKTGLEKSRNAPLIDFVETEHGLIPKNREDIFSILIKR